MLKPKAFQSIEFERAEDKLVLNIEPRIWIRMRYKTSFKIIQSVMIQELSQANQVYQVPYIYLYEVLYEDNV